MMYTVGEMAKLLGIPSSTLRYYDKEGLLPFVERSSAGIRMFHEKDYEWLQVISCLKKAGMSLKDIKQYIHLAMEGDVLDYKCWYYETAKEAGTVRAPQTLSINEMPPQFCEVKKELVKIPVVD